MAKENRLWGAERIWGELLKLDIRVCPPHHSKVHESRAHQQATSADVEHVLTHACGAYLGVRLPACYGSPLRIAVGLFIIELHSRKVIYVGVHTSPRSPTDAWTAQQLREATAYGAGPRVPHPG